MSLPPDQLRTRIEAALGDALAQVSFAHDELTIRVPASRLLEAMTRLRDAPELRFVQLIDLCGVDWSGYGDGTWDGARFSAAYHLLSLDHNARLRVHAFAIDDEFPVLPSVTEVWAGANWYEREAFDLFGIVFEGHPDLRRILTDYGFVGHPFRKDFPVTGYVEMRYDPDQKRVVYQPVTIEPREIVPRIIREGHYADSEGFRKG